MRVVVAVAWFALALYGGWLGTDVTITPESPLYKIGAVLYALMLGLTLWLLVQGGKRAQ